MVVDKNFSGLSFSMETPNADGFWEGRIIRGLSERDVEIIGE